MVHIVQKSNDTLRKIAKEVPLKDITSEHVKKIISDMKEALASQDDGVALAAPQIDVSLRIFVIAGKAFLYAAGRGDGDEKVPPDMVFINPEILKLSKKRVEVPEGCLSVRWLYGKTLRAEKTKIRAYDENGKRFEYGGSGLIAQIFQHETDHLNGILFTDHAGEIQDIPPEQHPKHTHESRR